MRKELSTYFKLRKIGSPIIISLILIFFFTVINGIFIYSANPDNNYFYTIKRVLPYPAFVIGNRVVYFSEYESYFRSNKRIYETAYRIDFGASQEGTKNLEALEDKTKKELINKIIIEAMLDDMGMGVSKKNVQEEYDSVVNNMTISDGKQENLSDLLKYSPGIRESDIKKRIYLSSIMDKFKREVIYNLELKVIAIYPEDSSKEEDWNEARERAESILSLSKKNPAEFDKYFISGNVPHDLIVSGFGRDYYFADDLPGSFSEEFYNLQEDSISNNILKTDVGYYLLKSNDSRGYYKGSLDDYLDEQKSKIRIIDLVH